MVFRIQMYHLIRRRQHLDHFQFSKIRCYVVTVEPSDKILRSPSRPAQHHFQFSQILFRILYAPLELTGKIHESHEFSSNIPSK